MVKVSSRKNHTRINQLSHEMAVQRHLFQFTALGGSKEKHFKVWT